MFYFEVNEYFCLLLLLILRLDNSDANFLLFTQICLSAAQSSGYKYHGSTIINNMDIYLWFCIYSGNWLFTRQFYIKGYFTDVFRILIIIKKNNHQTHYVQQIKKKHY